MNRFSSNHETPKDADVQTFDTWGAFVTQASKRGKTRWQSAREIDGHRTGWSGAASLDEALKMATDGWPEGEEKIRAMSRRLEVKLIHRIVREDINYDVEGMGFDVARYLNGEPEHWTCMEESTMQAEGQRHVKLMVNVAVSCGVDPETIMARGAAIGALCELLEYAGHHVELWICDTESDAIDGAPFYQRYTRVKAYDQHVEPSRLAFALVSPACQRRLGFSLMEQARPDITPRLSSGYGISVDAPPSVREEASLYLGRMQGYQHAEWSTPEAAETWVLAQLAAQGVVLSDE